MSGKRAIRHLPPVGIDPESLADTFYGLCQWMIEEDQKLKERGFDPNFIFRLQRRENWRHRAVECKILLYWEARWDSWMYAVMGWELDEEEVRNGDTTESER